MYLANRALAQTCIAPPFPRFIGGISGGSDLRCIDFNPVKNQLVAGGKTSDTGLVSYTKPPNLNVPLIVMHILDPFA